MRRGLLLALASLWACDPGAPSLVEVRAPEDTRNAAGPYRVTVVTRGAVERVVVRWTDAPDASAALEARLRLDDDGGGRWSGDLPGRPPGSDVRLAVEAEGPGGDARWPPRGEHRFRVLGGDGACLVDGDCLPAEVCDRLERRCHVPPARCRDDGDCPQDYVCAPESGACRFRPLPCEDDRQCGAGQVCAGGFCAPAAECRDDGDCPEGARCLEPPGRCAGADACVRDGDCPADRPRCDAGRCRAAGPGCDPPCDPGAVCVDGACVAGCDPACGAGEVCRGGRCEPGGCDPACGAGEVCRDGRCVTGCDPACGAGEVCRDGRCEPEGCDPACGPGDRCVEGRCVRERCEPECAVGEVCVGDRCVAEQCGVPCAVGEVCVRGLCVPEGCVPACGAGLVCVDGRCLPPPDCANGCPDGLHCRRGAGVCVQCTADGHCPMGTYCNAEFNCALGERGAPCVPCGRGRTCGAGFVCREDLFDACVPRCGPRGLCPSGFRCDGVACLPDLFCRGAECVRDGDCESAVCAGGVCEAPQQCQGDEDCRDRRCVAGRCVPRAPACVDGCPDGTLCVGGRCVAGEPVNACAPCGEAADCDSPAFCGDPFGAGVRQCHALCAGDCPGDLRCTAFSDATSVCVSPEDGVCPRVAACRDDDLEDNDDERTATRLGGGADVRGVACAGDPDVFLLEPRRGQQGTVTIDPRGRLRYRFTDGRREREGEIGGVTRLDVGPNGAVLTLTARAEAAYRVTTDFRAGDRACANDGLEPNDSAEDAVPVEVPVDLERLVLCPGDHDFARFWHDGAATVVRIEFSHALGDIDAELLDPAGRQVATSTGNGDVERFDLGPQLAVGDYVVHVYPFNPRAPQTNYRLVVGR
jgi:Cys-rich repeat protein